MALSESFTTVSTVSTNASAVPLYKRKGVSSFKDLLKIAGEHGFAREMKPYLGNKGKHLIRAAVPYLVVYESVEGEFRTAWRNISNAGRGKMCQKLAAKAPWLLYFEQEWASDWILSRLLNQRVWDRNRKGRQNFSDQSDSNDSNNSDDSDDSDNSDNQDEIAGQGMETEKISEGLLTCL